MTARITNARKPVAAVAVVGSLLVLSPLVARAVTADDPAPDVTAKGAALVDGRSGAALFDKAADTARPMASTAKIMVASVVLDTDGVDLDRRVTVRKQYRDYVAKHHASTADLQTGDKVSVRQLLYASLLPSGADAAYALADTYGTGDSRAERVGSFLRKMNAKARQLRLRKTAFDTFDGTRGDTSTPTELAKLTRHAMRHSTFRKVAGTKRYKGDAPAANGRTRTYTWTNTNQLLGAYDGAVGIKTGTTERAGKCLVFAATRDGRTLVGTVLDSDDRYTDAAKLLDHGFGSDSAKDLKIRELPSGSQHD
ncbi:D-alanyl-D-alanine carboxypeptidase [Streptomyces qinglanensis]|uniref:D-alanyl-D-alanine carboxypeptidase n=1 Tax=Streptomyces qinglanensis TaxID=943816 RepID=A0A1E7KDN2_9ACTN|nr:serine hydrolase [Streptomyces qinglanensis]OEV01954.1 D-alanyl-D-alanine carboxypeptidase [Streptomyces qinglanensis]OEV07777.1 D-alanyl-D-alanine carboxypeptidase [Streptomyces nanshensis]